MASKRRIKNYNSQAMTYASPIQGAQNPTTHLQGQQSLPSPIKHNLSNYIAPVQLLRLKHDIRMWRDAVTEAELAYYPQRIKMQRMFLDTALNGHVKACTEKRKDLTLLRRFEIRDAKGKKLADPTLILQESEWFQKFISYTLDAIFYGYSLIALGDIQDNDLPNLTIIKRWNVSPDRFNVTSYDYAITGQDFRADDVKDWHVYVDTPTETGTSPCGYGLFYNVALYEIFLRNILGYNGDFVERYSMPYVHAKTTKQDESERGEFENAIANMGSAGYAITDPQDEIEFLEASLAGTGWNGYDNLENRCEKKISKLLLGHADAMDSTPGRLGADQGGDESPITKALSEKQIKDGRMVERIVNKKLLPRLISLGQMPDAGWKFVYLNDDEIQETIERETANAKALAEVGASLNKAGIKMSPEYFTQKTGIPVEMIEQPEPASPMSESVKNKLKNLYRIK